MRHGTHSRAGSGARRRALPATTLVTTAIVLLALGCAGWLVTLPTLLPSEVDSVVEDVVPASDPTGAEKDEEPAGEPAEKDDAEIHVDDTGETEGQEASQEPEGEPEQTLPEASLEGVPDVSVPEAGDDSPSDPGQQGGGDAPAEDGDTDQDEPANPGGAAEPEPPANDDENQEVTGDDFLNSTPSEAEEREFRSFLSGKASLISGYVSQANACVAAFERDCTSADLATRQADQRSCLALEQQIFSTYIEVRDRPRSNNSQYCDEQDELIAMFRLLASYVGCYGDAWALNVAYEDPAAHTTEFMAPLSGASAHLSQFQALYQGFSI